MNTITKKLIAAQVNQEVYVIEVNNTLEMTSTLCMLRDELKETMTEVETAELLLNNLVLTPTKGADKQTKDRINNYSVFQFVNDAIGY